MARIAPRTTRLYQVVNFGLCLPAYYEAKTKLEALVGR